MIVIPFTLRLQEPVLATAPGGDPNTDESQRFIPGSAIRGALASRYWKTHDRDNNDDEVQFHRLFLNGDSRFLNAYPAGSRWSQMLPPPRHWATLKDGNNKIYNLASSASQDGILKPVKKAFVEIIDKQAVPSRIDYEVAVHNARDRELGRATETSGELFSYRALAAGQQFAGAVVVENAADAAIVRALFTPDEMLLGGSRSAGYGLTQVTVDKDALDWAAWRKDAFGKATDIVAGEAFMVYLASDAILRHPDTGQETADIIAILNARLPEHAFAAAKRPSYAFASMGWVGGFNQKWGLPLPQTWALRRGSVWVLRAQKPLTAAEMTALEQAGIGDRRAEGYGRLIFNPDWLSGELLLAEPGDGLDGTTANGHEISALSQKLIDQMNERILRRGLDRLVIVAAQENGKKSRGHLSNSQLARLRLQVRNGLTAFGKYLAGTHERKSADDQFSKFVVNSHNFRKTLEELVQEPGKVWEKILTDDWKPLTIGAATDPRHDQALTHHYVVRYIDAMCEQLAKKGGDR